MVDEDGVRLHAGEGAVLTEHDTAQVVVIADAGGHDIGVARCLGRRGGGRTAILVGPLLRLGGRAVIDRDLMTGTLQMTGHGITHHAQAEKRDTDRRCLR